jgi:Protein of unknown function (DUF3105)
MRLRLLALVLGALALFAVGCTDDAPAPEPQGKASADPPQGEPAPEGIDGVIAVKVPSRNHVKGTVEYDTYPPVGGDHNPVWHSCGFWVDPIADENAVHSMEHGAVWIAFRPDLPADEVDVIEAAADSNDHVLAAPYPGLRAPIVMTAWGRQLDLDSATDPRFAEFVTAYVGSVAPEQGASCSGGVTGTPPS